MKLQARIRRIDLDPAGFRSIELHAPGYEFSSGQYLRIRCDGVDVPLSIASCRSRLPELHLIYRSDRSSDAAVALDALLTKTRELTLLPAAGDVRLPAAHGKRTLELIAAGSGLAGALGLADAALRYQPHTDVTLHTTSAHTPSWMRRLRAQHPRLRIERHDDGALSQHHWACSDNHWYLLCGSPKFVYRHADRLRACGADAEQIASDVFAYAPRE